MSDYHHSDKIRFEFKGTASEFFGIWIVNLLLSIVTIGIYSAWAKVRTKKYFYQHTFVAGRNFDYHATGLQILIGRAIVIFGLIVFSMLSAIPIVGLLLILGLLAITPYLITRALRFNAMMSSWSNVRFRFDGGTGRAFLVYILYPILTALTLYTAFPFLDRAVKRFTIDNHRLGDHRFSLDAPIGPFYRGLLAAFGWAFGVGAFIFAVVAIQIGGTSLEGIENNPTAAMLIGTGFYAGIFLAIFPAAAIYQAFTRNVVFNSTELEGGHQFYSDVQPITLVWIAISNTLAVIFTLGLMLPWARVRMARYLADHTAMVPGESLDGFVGRMEAQSSAIGDAYSDIEGIELGLPV